MSTTPGPARPSNPTILQSLFSSKTDANISHFIRMMSTTAGVDATLCCVGYALYTVSYGLRRVATLPVTRQALILRLYALLRRIANANPAFIAAADATASKAYAAAEKAPSADDLAKTLTDAGDGARVLGGLCSEVRMFLRLWGLAKIYVGAKAAYHSPPSDTLLKLLAWAQLGTMGTYLVLEHNYFLTAKGILKGVDPAKAGRWARTSIAVYGAYLAMDYIRLWRVAQTQEAVRHKSAGAGGVNEKAKLERDDQDRAWWRALQVNLSYTPCVLHWMGYEWAQMTDFSVGLLGASAGYAGMKEAWRTSA